MWRVEEYRLPLEDKLPIAETLEAPQWVDSGAVITGGIDLLGLRLPVQAIGATLLDGITTVTPQVRYLAFRAWLIHRYGQTGLPDSLEHFTEFALRVESALVLGNLLQDRGIRGLIGADKAVLRLDAGAPELSIAPLVQSPASTIYAGASDELGITRKRDPAVPALVLERGMPLAKLVDRRFSTVPLVERLTADAALDDISREDLLELGSLARIDQIPDDERDAILAAVVPTAPRTQERPRVATYMALLTLADTLGARPSEQHVFDAACSKRRFGEPALDQAADGWLTYCVRDVIAVTQEAVLSQVMTELTASPDRGLSGMASSAVVTSLMERVEEHSDALRELGLLSAAESVSSISFRQLQQRIEAHIAPGIAHRDGIARWNAPLVETRVYQASWRAGAGALSVALVAWILAGLRVGRLVREGGPGFGHLSYHGWRRLGLRDVILPDLERFEREDRSVRDVAAELAHRTVNQHLQIAWSRLQADPRRDVGLLTTEGSQWITRGKGFHGGRTGSRLIQTLGWLEQLRLIDARGITADGKDVLGTGLRVLSTGSAA